MEHRKLGCDLQTGFSWLKLWTSHFPMWTWWWSIKFH